MTDTLPSGLTLVSMNGIGWTCNGATCSRSDALSGGSSYPPIIVTVNVAVTATSPQNNAATVFGGGGSGHTATDVTTISPQGGGSMVTLTIGNRSAVPGAQVTVPMAIATVGTLPGSFAADLSYDAGRLAFISATAGSALTAGQMSLTTSPLSSNSVRLLAPGLNQNRIVNGTVADVVFTLNQGFVSGDSTSVTLGNCRSSDVNSSALLTTCVPGTIRAVGNRCDLNGDGSAGIADIQTLINMVLGITPPTPQGDLNGDGAVTVADIQMLVNVVWGTATCPN